MHERAFQTTKLRCSCAKLVHRLHENLRILYYFPGDVNNVFVERQFPRCSRITVSAHLWGGSVENNIQSRTKQSCGFRGSASLILLPATLRRAVPCAPTGLLLSWPENGQRVVATAQGTLIETLPNYHVGSELAPRLLDSRVVRKSRGDQYHSVVVIKSPTLRVAFKAQHIYPNVVCTYIHANVCWYASCVSKRNTSIRN